MTTSVTSSTVSAQLPVAKPYPFVPKNMSPEAQEFLRTMIPFGVPSGVEPDWKAMRDGYRFFSAERNARAQDQFVEKIERKEIANTPVSIVTPKGYSSSKDMKNEKIMIYLHGGAFTLGSHEHLYHIFAPVAQKAGLKAFAIDYSLSPEDPFPKAINECCAVYKELIKTYDPENIVFFGDSAGANLCVATILKARDEGLPFPNALGVYSVMVDFEKTSDTLTTLDGIDPILSYDHSIVPSISVYLKKEDVKNPYASVIHADFKKGFVPTEIHSGTRDVMLSDCCRFNDVLHKSGVFSFLRVKDGGWHGMEESLFPEAWESIDMMVDFFKEHLKAK